MFKEVNIYFPPSGTAWRLPGQSWGGDKLAGDISALFTCEAPSIHQLKANKAVSTKMISSFLQFCSTWIAEVGLPPPPSDPIQQAAAAAAAGSTCENKNRVSLSLTLECGDSNRGMNWQEESSPAGEDTNGIKPIIP